MHTIKFRGKSLSTGEWVYGYYIQGANNKHFIAKSLNVDVIEVDPKTVGQYIGIKDKDENEIYEGDIVRGYSASFDFEGNDTGEIETVVVDDITDIRRVLRDFQQSTLDIIGSIHDNPDLLTQ